MSDIFSPEKRSKIMSKVRTEGTDIEEVLGEIVKEFWQDHRYHKNVKKLPGSPDIVFLNEKVAVFADGDFWHGKNYEEEKDQLNDFWLKKIKKNMERDVRQKEQLEEMGYTVLRFWGSEIKKEPERVRNEVKQTLENYSI